MNLVSKSPFLLTLAVDIELWLVLIFAQENLLSTCQGSTGSDTDPMRAAMNARRSLVTKAIFGINHVRDSCDFKRRSGV